MKQVRMWVDPRFKKKVKREAVNKDMSVLELTAHMASDDCELMQMFNKAKRRQHEKKKGFMFRI